MPKKKEQPSVVTFAFKLSAVQREMIHKAAGRRQATRFVREAALAAAEKVLAK